MFPFRFKLCRHTKYAYSLFSGINFYKVELRKDERLNVFQFEISITILAGSLLDSFSVKFDFRNSAARQMLVCGSKSLEKGSIRLAWLDWKCKIYISQQFGHWLSLDEFIGWHFLNVFLWLDFAIKIKN